jgi:hypothetical protein
MGFLPELDENGFLKRPREKKRRNFKRRAKKSLSGWQQRKRAYYKHHEKRCKICGSRLDIELHHIYYPKKRGAELDHDLVPLCRWHHLDFHEKYGSAKDMRTEWAIYYLESRS